MCPLALSPILVQACAHMCPLAISQSHPYASLCTHVPVGHMTVHSPCKRVHTCAHRPITVPSPCERVHTCARGPCPPAPRVRFQGPEVARHHVSGPRLSVCRFRKWLWHFVVASSPRLHAACPGVRHGLPPTAGQRKAHSTGAQIRPGRCHPACWARGCGATRRQGRA